MLLGDGHLELPKACKNARLHIGLKDKEFTYHLWDLFNSIGIVGSTPKEKRTIIKPSGNLRVSYKFATFTLPYLTHLHSQWYKLVDGKTVKVIPGNILSLLTPRALAYWLSSCRLRSDPTGWTTLRSDPTGWTTAGAGAVALSGPAPDGSYNKRDCCVVIATDSYTAEEVDTLRLALLNNFKIHSTRNGNGKGQDQYIIVSQNEK